MTERLASPLVETDWLEKHLADEDLRILDCAIIMKPNDDGTYGFVSGIELWQESHIPGSIHVDIQGQLSDQEHAITLMMPAPETLAETLKALGIGDENRVVIYDRGNHAWAARVWWMLRAIGFDNAAVLNGSWPKWTEEGRPVSAEKQSYPPARNLTINPRPELFIDKQGVKDSLQQEDILRRHSLPLTFYNGEVNAYKRPGRIPASHHLYCEEMLDSGSNCYVSVAEMARIAKEKNLDPAKKVITYCGGGIAASSNALALTMAGFDNIAVYDGSLTEWTSDPEMPMEE